MAGETHAAEIGSPFTTPDSVPARTGPASPYVRVPSWGTAVRVAFLTVSTLVTFGAGQ